MLCCDIKSLLGLLLSGWKKIKLRVITLKGVTSVCVAHIILLFYLHTFIYVTRLIGVIFEKPYCGPLNAFAKRHTLKGLPTLKIQNLPFRGCSVSVYGFTITIVLFGTRSISHHLTAQPSHGPGSSLYTCCCCDAVCPCLDEKRQLMHGT